MSDAGTITLGAVTITPPRSPKRGPLAAIVVYAYGQDSAPAAREAAALGFLWESGAVASADPKVTTRPPAEYRACASSPVRYGEAVVEALLDRGFDLIDIVRAGREAVEWMAPHIITERELSEATGNSPAA